MDSTRGECTFGGADISRYNHEEEIEWRPERNAGENVNILLWSAGKLLPGIAVTKAQYFTQKGNC